MIKPILFNTDMVRAILEGKKTQTRRVIKPQPVRPLNYIMGGSNHGKWKQIDDALAKYWEIGDLPEISKEDAARLWTPPCHADDILWVRETWCKDVGRFMYRANYSDVEKFYMNGREIKMAWRPSIHMPKEAARLFLKVKRVRADRLQNITEAEIRAEGEVDMCCMCSFNLGYDDYTINCGKNIKRAFDCPLRMMHPDIGFFGLWDSTVKKDERQEYGWKANPWVWVIEFERCEKPEGWNDGR